jgi:hypothetical protein
LGERAIPLLKKKGNYMPNKYTQPPREKKNAAAASNLPVKTFQLGRIKAAVWENKAEQKFYTVTFARTYMDEAKNYHDTDSFGRMTCRWWPNWPIRRTRSFSSGSRS